jgi:hypothetical protein
MTPDSPFSKHQIGNLLKDIVFMALKLLKSAIYGIISMVTSFIKTAIRQITGGD